MSYETLDIGHRIRARRLAQNPSQRELSELSGVPQAQISRIESGRVDLRFSSLVALTHALDLEVALIPRQAMPAVKSVIRTPEVADVDRTGGRSRPALMRTTMSEAPTSSVLLHGRENEFR